MKYKLNVHDFDVAIFVILEILCINHPDPIASNTIFIVLMLNSILNLYLVSPTAQNGFSSILFLWVNTIYRMEPEVKVTEAVRNLLEDVDRNGKQQTEEIKEIEKYVKNEKQELSIPFSLVLYAYKNRSPGKTVYYDDISSHDSIFIPIIIRILHLLYK